jgi:hypothetical protein
MQWLHVVEAFSQMNDKIKHLKKYFQITNKVIYEFAIDTLSEFEQRLKRQLIQNEESWKILILLNHIV